MQYSQLPVYGAPAPDKVYQLENVLSNVERGNYSDASLLVDGMMRDDRVLACLTTRINGLLGAPLEIDPTKDTSKGRMMAEEIEDRFSEIFPESAISDLLAWGLMLGVGVGENVWTKSKDEWLPKLRVWHPQYLMFRWDTNSYWITPSEGAPIEITPNDNRWVLYTPYGYHASWRRSLVRSLAKPWMIRQWSYRDFARYCEIHGFPIRKAIVPMDASDKDKQRFMQGVANLGAETAMRCPQTNESKFDLELLEAKANSHAAFVAMLDKVETSIAINILGQNLTTEVKGGSFAAAKVSDNIRGDIRRFDAKTLAECLQTQTLQWWAQFNYGSRDLSPLIKWQTDPPEDGGQAATELKTLADALSVLKLAGAPVDVRAILEAHGVPMIEESETELGFVDDPSKEPQADVAEIPPPEVQIDPTTGEKTPFVVANKVALSARPSRQTRSPSAIYKRGQYYADSLAVKAKSMAAEAIQPDVKDMLSIIKTSKSFDEAKARIIHRYRHMDPTVIKKAVERAQIMANLAARHVVIEGL